MVALPGSQTRIILKQRLHQGPLPSMILGGNLDFISNLDMLLHVVFSDTTGIIYRQFGIYCNKLGD